MSDELEMTERIMEAVGHLNRAERLLIMEGVFENLEQLVAWSPHHHTQKLERELAKAISLIDRDMKCEAENARLRELLERAIENCECKSTCGSHVGDYCGCGRYARNEQIRDELARLATAPEETDQFRDADHIVDANEMVSSCCNAYCAKRIDGNVAYWDCDQCGATDKVENPVIQENRITEPAPEWRELGPDEVIQEGDEWRWGTHWFECKDSIGYKLHFLDCVVRTRRPLPPVVDQPQPITK